MIDDEPVRRSVISIDRKKTGMRVGLSALPQFEATLEAGPTGYPACIAPGRRERCDRTSGGSNSCWFGRRLATLYTKSANRVRLAAGAIGKLDRAKTGNRAPNSRTHG